MQTDSILFMFGVNKTKKFFAAFGILKCPIVILYILHIRVAHVARRV